MQLGMRLGMKRCLEAVDLMVVVGLCATVFGAYFLFMSSKGMLQANVTAPAIGSESVRILDAMDWVQPALGEAIVEDALLEYDLSQQLSQAALRLSQALLATMRSEPASIFDQIREQARQRQSAHGARVEYVSGRTIVEGTKRGLRTGALTVDRVDGRYNGRLIELSRSTRSRLETVFRDMQQPALGQAIVQAHLDQERLQQTIQHRLGETIRDLTVVQEQFKASQEALQGQLAAVAIAAVTTELRAELFTRSPAAEFLRPASLPFTAPAELPSVPTGLLIVATGLLVAIFFAGLSLTATPEPDVIQIQANGERWESIADVNHPRSPEPQEQSDHYRKSA